MQINRRLFLGATAGLVVGAKTVRATQQQLAPWQRYPGEQPYHRVEEEQAQDFVRQLMKQSLQPATLDAEFEEFVGQFYDDPLGFVECCFPWGKGPLAGFDGPTPHQREFLAWLGGQVAERAFDGVHAVAPIRAAISSGRGIGKGALTGMVVCWLMSTRKDCKGIVTANTNFQLQDKTWSQIRHWMKLCLTRGWFESNSTILYRIGSREDWKCAPQTCDESNDQAFAGMHNVRSSSFYIFDEASTIPDPIWIQANDGLTDGESMFFAFGNPSRRHGWFYDVVFGAKRGRWKGWVVDSRTSPLTNKGEISELLKEHDGNEDADRFRVMVRGLPPNASDAQFIDHERVRQAQQRTVAVLPDEPLVAGCDLAWGGRNANCIRFRRGRDGRSIPPIRIPGELTRDPLVLINRLADVLTTEYKGRKVTMLFVDSAGIAGPVVARLRQMGHRNIMEINFGADSPDPKRRYYRDHLWAEGKEWLATGAIDKDPRLERDLQTPMLREDLRQRIWLAKTPEGEESPDDADALFLTLAVPAGVIKPPTPKKARQRFEERLGGKSTGLGWLK